MTLRWPKAIVLVGALAAFALVAALACAAEEEEADEPAAEPTAVRTVPTPPGFTQPTPTTVMAPAAATAAPAAPTAAPAAATAAPPTAEPAMAMGNFGGTLEAVQGGNPFTMDTMSDTISAVTHPANQMMEQLFALDSALDAKPMLADSFVAEDGGATWTFTLRENVPFHDGQIMTADDVVASLDRWFHWDTVWGKTILQLLDTIEATDSRTVQIRLTEPFAPMLAALSMSEARQAVIHPASVIDKYPYKDLAEGAEKPRIEDADIIGTGPFSFDEWIPDVKIAMLQHSDYAERTEPLSFHSGKKTPFFDGIDVNIVPDASAALAGLLTGRYDIANPSLDQLDTLNENPDVEPFIAMTGRNESTFNATIPPFDNNLMRQAVAWSLNPEEILQGRAPVGLYELNQSPFYKFQTTWWRDDGWDIYSQVDLDKARALIEQAGYEPPVDIKYIHTLPETSGGRATLVVIQQLEDSGLWNVDGEENTWPIHVQVRWEKQHNIMYNGFNPFYQTDLLAPTWNDWEHPASGFLKADRRLELMEQRRKTTDPAEISRIADEFGEWWWEDVPLFSWGNFATMVGVRTNVQNYSYSGNPVYFGLWFEDVPEDR